MHLKRRLSFQSVALFSGPILALVLAFCGGSGALGSGDGNEPSAQLRGPVGEQLSQQALAPACSRDALKKFEKIQGEPIDVDTLPRGYFLYSGTDFLVESNNGKDVFSAIVHETPAFSHHQKIETEIVCVSGVATLKDDFLFAMTGLVKINTSRSSVHEFTRRQYSVAVHAGEVQVESMKIPASSAKPETLKQFLAAQGSQTRLLKTSERSYELLIVNDRVKSHGGLIIKFDFTPEI